MKKLIIISLLFLKLTADCPTILQEIPGSPFMTGGSNSFVAYSYSPSGRFAATANQDTNTVMIFSVNPISGVLTHVSTSSTGNRPIGVAFSPNENFLAVTNQNDATISIYTFNQFTGALTQISGSPFSTGTPGDCTILAGSCPVSGQYSPDGNFFVVANQGTSNIISYSVNQTTGALTQISNIPSGGDFPTVVNFSRDGNFVAIPNAASDSVSIYSFNAGILTQVPGSPFATGVLPINAAFSPDNQTLVVSNANSSNISVFAFNSSTGFLTQIVGSPFPVGPEPLGLAFFPNTSLLAITTGALTPGLPGSLVILSTINYTQVCQIALGENPRIVTFSPSGRFLAVAIFGAGTIAVFRNLTLPNFELNNFTQALILKYCGA